MADRHKDAVNFDVLHVACLGVFQAETFHARIIAALFVAQDFLDGTGANYWSRWAAWDRSNSHAAGGPASI